MRFPLAPEHAARLLLLAARRVGTLRELEFDPSQPRDESGRWTDGSEWVSRSGVDQIDMMAPIPRRLKPDSYAAGFVHLYHVTSIDSAKKIDVEGLKAAAPNQFQGFESQYDIYGWGNLDRARLEVQRLEETSPGVKSDLAIVHFQVPSSEWDRLRADEDTGLTTSWKESYKTGLSAALVGDVPPEWIIGHYVDRSVRALEFNPNQPRDEQGQWTSTGAATLTPEQQLEQDKRNYLTPDEFAKLPPGIQKWKAQKRKAEAEAKKVAGEKKSEPQPEPKPELKVEPKPETTGPSVREREKAITERMTELQREGKSWAESTKLARQEDLDRFGPMPANTLRDRQQAITDRAKEIRQVDPSVKFEKAYDQAKREDAATHGPWLEPDQIKEREELLASDKNWTAGSAIAKLNEEGAERQIKPRPEIDPKERTPRQQEYEAKAAQIARELGHDPNLIVVRDYAGRTFELNGQTLSEAGHYNPHTGLIELNAARDTGKGIVIHEIQHAQWDYVRGRAHIEQRALHSRWSREQAYDFSGERYFTKDGKVLARHRQTIEEQTPHLSLIARAGLGSRELGIKPDIAGLSADDGVSSYSTEYWKQAAQKGGGVKSNANQASYMYELAVNETLSETMRRSLRADYSSDYSYKIAPRFTNLSKEIQRLYQQNPEAVRRHFARKSR